MYERLSTMSEIKNYEFQTQFTIVKKYHRHVLWLILGLLFALDILTTTIGLQQGSFEKNQFMIPFVNNPLLHGIVKIIGYIFLFFVVESAVFFIQEEKPEKKTFWIKLNLQTLYGMLLSILIYLIWFYLSVVVSNILVIS
jgi:cellulose synthase/poly-beta-1,6-N-acetylglucosamine synthase-like glycosyltransferase